MKSLYPAHKVSSVQVVFDSLAAHSMNFAKELANIFQDKKAVCVTIEKAEKCRDNFSELRNCETAHVVVTVAS